MRGILENKYDLVCLNLFLRPYSNNLLNSNFTKFTKDNDLRKISLHDLRHTNATLTLQGGTNLKVVSESLGHTYIKISMNKYSIVLEEMDKEASNNLSNILFKQKTDSQLDYQFNQKMSVKISKIGDIILPHI